MCAGSPRHLGKGAQMPPPFHPRLVRKAPWRPIPGPRCFRSQRFGAAPRPKSLRALWKPDQGRLRSPPCRAVLIALPACPPPSAVGWTPSTGVFGTGFDQRETSALRLETHRSGLSRPERRPANARWTTSVVKRPCCRCEGVKGASDARQWQRNQTAPDHTQGAV